jgi:hypothetical protein
MALMDAGPGLRSYSLRVFKRGWKQGEATIVARETHEGQYRRGINTYAPTGVYHHVYDYIADVEPDDGSPAFRARFVEMFESDTERRPLVGQTARVKYNPKTEETAFDRDVLWKEAKAEKRADKEGFDSIAAEPAGSPTGKPGLAGEVARQIETKLREEGK